MDALAAYTLSLALAVALCLGLAFLGFMRREIAGALPLAFLLVASALYAFGSIFEIRAESVEGLQFWLSFEYLGIAFIGPLWLLLALSVSGGKPAWMSALLVALFAFELSVLAMVWIDGGHRLFYSSLSLARRGPFSVSVLGKGPWYWAHMACMNACILAGNAVLLAFALRAPSAYKGQAYIAFAGSLFPWTLMLVYQFGLSPYGLDVAPFGIPLSGLLFTWCFLRHKFLDLGLIAYERIFLGMNEGVIVLDRKGRILGENPAMAEALGAVGRDLVGDDARRALGPLCPELAELVSAGAPAGAEVRIVRDGRARRYEARLASIPGSRGRDLGLILSLSDVTIRSELAERLAELATVDGLTGVSNRRTVLEVAGLELQRARRQGLSLSVLILDLDLFKQVNDRHGHQAGDAVLKAAAQACAACLRATDRFGRYGGEEFVALLPGIGPAEARAAAERLRAAVSAARVESGGASIGVTASVGCSGRDRFEAETMDDLVREADEALYRAKAAGRDRVEVHGA